MAADVHWILVADQACARLFEARGRRVKEIETFENPAGRLHDRDLLADEHGRAFDSAGQGRHAFSTEESPVEHEAHQFVRSLADFLHNSRSANRFDRLSLIAEPRMLGLLRDALDDPTRKMIHATLDKDVVHEEGEQLERHLAEVNGVAGAILEN